MRGSRLLCESQRVRISSVSLSNRRENTRRKQHPLGKQVDIRRAACIVPADGFYEWRTENRKKLPVHFRLKDRSRFGFAGIWDVWKGPNGAVFTCAILTTEPNELTATVHN